MNRGNQELAGYERYGRLAGNAYAGASLSRSQRDRHLARLAETGSRRQDVSVRFQSRALEFAAITAVLLVAVALVAVWQALGSPADNDAASLPTTTSVQQTPEPSMESGAAILTPTITQNVDTSQPQGSMTVPVHTATPMNQAAEERIAQLERERQQLRPQPVPETCQVTGWAGPDFRVRRSDYYAYWLEGDGLALGERHGVLFAGENNVGWLASSGMSTEEVIGGEIEITSERLDGDAAQPVSLDVGTQISTNIITDDSVERGWESTLTFPEPGCWNIQAQIGPNTLNATVYVFSVGESE